MFEREPTRWAEAGSDAPPGVADAIELLRQGKDTAPEVQALSRRLSAELAAPTRAGSAVWLSPSMKAAGVALLSAVALGLYAWTHAPGHAPERRPAEATHPPAARAPALSQPPARAPRPADGEGTAAPPAVAAPTPRPGTREPREAVATGSREPAAAPGEAALPRPAPEGELALLKRCQAALDRDAEAALSLAEQHAEAYPRGVFAQEREVLAIEALVKLRRRAPALVRAEAFLQRFPGSPHAVRVRALVERSGTSPGGATIEGAGAHPWEETPPEAPR